MRNLAFLCALAGSLRSAGSALFADAASAQWGQVARQVCGRNVYGQFGCWMVANEAYTYGRQVAVNQYRDLRYPPQRYYAPQRWAYPQSTPYMIRRR